MAATLGHGWIGGRNGNTALSSYYSQISAEAEVKYIFKSFKIAAMNPSSGGYDFSGIGTELDYLFSQGGSKKLRIEIPLKKFGAIANAGGWVPSWWGARDTAWSAASNGSAVLIRLDNPTIRGYVLDFYAALGTYLAAHPRVSLVDGIDVGSETALSNPYDVNGNAISISASIWQAAYEALMSGARSRLTGFSLRAYGNGFSLVSQTQYIDTILGYGIDEIGNSDTEPFKNNDLGNHNRMVAMSQYAADCILHHNVEDGNYNITCVTPANYTNPTYASLTITRSTAGSAMMKLFVDAHVNYYKTAKLSWLNSQYGSSGSGSNTIGQDIKAAIAAYGPSGLNTFPVISVAEPPVDPPDSATGVTFKPIQTALPTAGTPPVAHPVAHSLPAAAKLAFIYLNKATANETNTAAGVIGFGASDFTNQWAVTFRANAANPTQTSMRAMTDKCAALALSGSNNIDVEIDDGTPDATNINFSITDLPASAYLAEMWAACGDGLLRCVATANLSTQDTAVTVTATDPTTGLTFQPNAAIVATLNTTFNDTAVNHAQWSKGIACVNSSAALVQKCYMLKNENAVSPSEPVAKLHTTRVGGIISTADAETFTVQIAFTSTGCTVTAKGGDGTGAAVGLILMRLSGIEQDLVDITFPTTTGNHSFDVGGPLDFGMLVGTGLDTVDSIDTTNAANFFISSFTPTASALLMNTYEDAQTTADDRARTALKPIYLYSQDGATKILEATFANQADPNVTFNFTTAPATAYKGFLWRFAAAGQLSGSEESVSVPTVIDLSGYTDYVRLGIGSATGMEHKADGGSQITVSWNNAPAGVFTGGSTNYPQFSATNSAPSGALAASAARSYWGTVGDKVTITVPADQETSSIDAWINASGVDIDIVGSISDGSATDYEDSLSSANTTTGAIVRSKQTIDFQAVNSGQTVTITAEITAVNAVNGNMSVQAVGLTNNYIPPADIIPPSLVFGYPQLVSMTETAPGSELYDIVVSIQLSEAGEVFAQARLGTNTADPTSAQVEAGTDGAGSSSDIVGDPAPNTAIDFLETVLLTVGDVPGGDDYWIDIGAKDAVGNYMVGAYSMPVTTPAPNTGGGGGEGTYSVTVQLSNGTGSTANDTAVKYAWIDDADMDFDTATSLSGTWAAATSGPTGLLTVNRSTTDQGYLVVLGDGIFYRSRILTPA